MRLEWKLLAKRAKLPAAGAALLALLFGAYWLGGIPPAATATAPSASIQDAPHDEPQGNRGEEPAPVSVPHSASGARSSGSGGETWMSGDPSRLGAEFKRSVTNQFGNGSLGQAHMAMAGLGFQCGMKSGRMDCTKSIQADNCTLTWSVRLEASGGSVGRAGGEGFSRDCAS